MTMEQFADKCEAGGVKVSPSCSLLVRRGSLPQVEEFKYLKILFRSDGIME